ncbi:MAG: nucleoside diphosphate kinase regulator [Flavisolibacter sp.]|nr:nucleoside diphosphate kinase regulator [Flavisolibacter sp.]MBD0351133.1 nucleoside diphosphate kinase regulator [Flavisolibacter sp.]MBD0369203.1 nucleoside diphosphate kinase regulator [Flavisolibacter sp.]
MKKKDNGLVLRKDDYEIILSYLRGGQNKSAFDRQNAEELQAELKKAKLVDKDNFPHDVVRLNSKVKIAEANKDKVMELTLVTPDKADISKGKISIMAPIGTALIGFRQGQKVKWQVPAGKKTFTILEVIN